MCSAGIRADIQVDASPANVNAVLRNNLERLHTEHRVAVENNYARLSPWIGSMVEDLGQVLRSASFSTGTSNGNPDAMGISAASANSTNGKQNPLLGLFNLVEPLTKRASVPPASSKKLNRNFANLFSAQAGCRSRAC